MFNKIENKELDLLAAYYRKDGPSSLEVFAKRFGIPLGIVLVVACVCLFLFVSNMSLQASVDDLNSQNEALQTQLDLSDNASYQEYIALQGTSEQLDQINAQIAALPRITRTKINGLQSAMYSGMSMTSLSYQQGTGQIAISATSSNVRNIERYITRLKANSDYTSVTYKGYTESTTTNTVDTGEVDPVTGLPVTTTSTSTFYSFNVTVTVDGGE